MSTKGWIFVALGAGVVIAVVLGVFSQSETAAQRRLCSSLASLRTDVASLKESDPSTVSKESLQSTFSSIQSDWGNVKNDASEVLNINVDKLDDAWNVYIAQLRSIPSDASPSDALNTLSEQTQTLETEVRHTIGDIDCSSQ
jgi:hypothetical protein